MPYPRRVPPLQRLRTISTQNSIRQPSSSPKDSRLRHQNARQHHPTIPQTQKESHLNTVHSDITSIPVHSPVRRSAREEVADRNGSNTASLHPKDERQTTLFFEQTPSPIVVDSGYCPEIKKEETDVGIKIGG